LALAAGEFVRSAGGKLSGVEANYGKEFVDAISYPYGVPVFKRRDQSNVLRDRKMREKPCFLNDIANTAPKLNGIPFDSWPLTNDDLAASGNDHPIDEPE
jgi:hypothetical protein